MGLRVHTPRRCSGYCGSFRLRIPAKGNLRGISTWRFEICKNNYFFYIPKIDRVLSISIGDESKEGCYEKKLRCTQNTHHVAVIESSRRFHSTDRLVCMTDHDLILNPQPQLAYLLGRLRNM